MKNIIVGDKIWITYAWKVVEAQVIGVYAEGKVVEYIIPFDKSKITWIHSIFNWYMTVTESAAAFKKRIIK